MINVEKNGQLFSKTCFGMLMPSSLCRNMSLKTVVRFFQYLSLLLLLQSFDKISIVYIEKDILEII